MSSPPPSSHPSEFYSPAWCYEAKTPIVDGKIEDPKTGAIVPASGPGYLGPPAVDIVIMSLHEDSNEGIFRAARCFPVEKLLYQVMRVVHKRGLELDSLNATTYALRVVLSHELTKEEFGVVADEMVNGVYRQGSE